MSINFISYISFWIGFVTVAILLMCLAIVSYKKGTRKLTNQEVSNLGKTLGSIKTIGGLTLAGISIIILIVVFSVQSTPNPFLLGIFIAASFFVGVMVLLDNFVLRAMFAWNSKDPRVQKLINSK